jgi:hypothetical protein
MFSGVSLQSMALARTGHITNHGGRGVNGQRKSWLFDIAPNIFTTGRCKIRRPRRESEDNANKTEECSKLRRMYVNNKFV